MQIFNEALVSYTFKGSVSGVQNALTNGADINYVNNRQGNPHYSYPILVKGTSLVQATYLGHTEVVQHLITRGADVNKFGKDCYTPLSASAEKGRLIIVEYLSQHGANVDYLVTVGAEFGQTDKLKKEELVRLAIQNGCLNFVKFLFTNNEKASQTDFDLHSLLRLAHDDKQLEIAKFLTTQTDINRSDQNGNTLLSKAVQLRNTELAKWLLDNGAQFSIYTAFLTSIDCQNLDMVQLLIKRGVPVNMVYKNGYTPLIKAIESGNLEFVDELIRNNANVNMFDGSGNSPLIKSIERRNLTITKLLIVRGANVNQPDGNGNLPIIKSVETQQLEIVRELVDNGASLDLSDKEENLPLLKALDYNNTKIVEILIGKGADITVVNAKKLLSYLMTYISEGNIEMVKRLAKKKEYIDITASCGYSPLTKSVHVGNFEIVKHLVEQGANVNMTDHHHNIPLAMAASTCKFIIFDYLLEAGGDVNLATKEIKKYAEDDENFAIYFKLRNSQLCKEDQLPFGSNQEEASE